MKKFRYLSVVLALALVGSCKQEPIIPVAEPAPVPPTPPTYSKGTADFSKFVAVGNSFVAGMQAFALYNDAQANSMARIMAKQFESVGGATTFNQPDIGSVNGYNPINSVPGVIKLGRLVLFDPDGSGPRSAAPYPAGYPGAAPVTCPSAVPATPALPAPYNTADIPTAFTGDKAALNNFAVPLIYTGQSVIPDTGNPASPYFQGLWARFASAPGVKSIAQDAAKAAGQGTPAPPAGFYLIWMGFDDVLLYAATGADNAANPAVGTYPMTDLATFTGAYNGLIATLTTATAFKGVVGNIPNFTNLPYFYTVPWNTIALDAATAATLTTNLANNYNGFLTAMVGAAKITQAEADRRKLTYAAGKNGVLLTDEDLTDLSPYMVGAAAALVPYAKARQAVATDLIPLAAGSVLGTCNGGNPQAVWGVSYPVPDRYALTGAETSAILTRTASFNSVISAAVAASGGRLVLADVNKAYADFVAAKVALIDGVTITPSFAPPTGAWSEDGIHPNARGYAFTANIFIDAISAGFSATIPKAKLSSYSGTGLPVNP